MEFLQQRNIDICMNVFYNFSFFLKFIMDFWNVGYRIIIEKN